jgi:hypothetical protein
MSSLRDTIVQYIDEQLDTMARRPEMWGPPHCVELQVLQLLEFRSVTLRPEMEQVNPRAVIDAYRQFLTRRFPGAPPFPLAILLERNHRAIELMPILGEFRTALVREMMPESEFAAHDLVLRLRMRPEVKVPSARSLSSYYDTFHRVLRAVARPTGSRGQAPQHIEKAIDFTMADVRVIPANGEPAQVILPLDQPEPAETERITDALDHIVTVNEWAANPRGKVTELHRLLGQEIAPQRVAAQVLRLMPGEEDAVQTVELGGRLIQRSEPVMIRPSYATRILEVISQEEHTLQEFDQVGVIRAIDMDQNSMRIVSTGRTFKCWMKYPSLLEVAKRTIGGAVRVIGQEYKEKGNLVIIVHKIRP